MNAKTIEALITWVKATAPKAVTGYHFKETLDLIKALEAEDKGDEVKPQEPAPHQS